MTLSDRDRKILVALVPLLCVAAFWFLALAPKRQEAADAGARLAQQEQVRDAAVLQADQLEATKRDFAAEYAELVRIGKAVPTKVDMPSLLVQIDQAARGTGIDFSKIAAGPREPALGSSASGAAGPADPVAAGGQPAQSGPGQATESAAETASDADAASDQRENADPDLDTATSTAPAGGGALPIGGGSVPTGSAAGGVVGLDTVPLQLEFQGRFFALAELFHRLKRFVRVANDQIHVRGRLLTVDNLGFSVNDEAPPGVLDVNIKATIYLAPSTPAAAAAPVPTPTPVADESSAPSPPTAAVTP